jgi:hypothetical protein
MIPMLDSQKRCRLGYFAGSLSTLIMTVAVPGTHLWASNSGGIVYWILVLIMYCLAASSFHLVQGSNPGYILDDASDPSLSRDIEECSIETDQLMRLDINGQNWSIQPKDENDNCEEKDDLLPSAKSSSLNKCPSSSSLPSYSQLFQSDLELKDTLKSSNNFYDLKTIEEYSYRPGGPSGPLKHDPKSNMRISERPKKSKSRNNIHQKLGDRAFNVRNGNTDVTYSSNNKNNFESYCKYCEICVPLRSHHCNSCQRCVATFDHHCFVISTCIGERNHCRFYVFILFNFLGTWWYSFIVDSAFSENLKEVTGAGGGPNSLISNTSVASNRQEIAYIVSAVLGIIWWYLLLLVVYQTFLVGSSSTGYECIVSNSSSNNNHSEDYDSCDSPYGGVNIFHNFYSFCCVRDEVIASIRGISWRPVNWKKPPPKPDIEHVEVCDNLWRNKYYSCC